MNLLDTKSAKKNSENESLANEMTFTVNLKILIFLYMYILQMFYQFVSFLTPGIIYRCDVTTDSYSPQVSADFTAKVVMSSSPCCWGEHIPEKGLHFDSGLNNYIEGVFVRFETNIGRSGGTHPQEDIQSWPWPP